MSSEIAELRGELKAHEAVCDQRHKSIDANFQRTSGDIRNLHGDFRNLEGNIKWGISITLALIVAILGLYRYLDSQVSAGPQVYQLYEAASKVTEK